MCEMENDQHIVQVKVTIQKGDPPIWRRLVLPLDLNLAQLHEVIQAAFGWTDSHLHQFIVGGLVYGAPEFDPESLNEHTIFEATEVQLRDFDFYHVPHPHFLYEYDFGDGWIHLVEIEALIRHQPGVKYPICTDGARHRPPEDVGGISGYAAFLEAWHDPEHEEHAANREWVGRAFDPEKFAIPATNKAIAAALRKAKGGYRFRQER
jgi:hypothetical protein